MLTKRVLDLAYLWTVSPAGIQLQIYATLMFFAVLLNLWQQVAQALREPLERSSVEMVFRAFYHFSRAVQRGESNNSDPPAHGWQPAVHGQCRESFDRAGCDRTG